MRQSFSLVPASTQNQKHKKSHYQVSATMSDQGDSEAAKAETTQDNKSKHDATSSGASLVVHPKSEVDRTFENDIAFLVRCLPYHLIDSLCCEAECMLQDSVHRLEREEDQEKFLESLYPRKRNAGVDERNVMLRLNTKHACHTFLHKLKKNLQSILSSNLLPAIFYVPSGLISFACTSRLREQPRQKVRGVANEDNSALSSLITSLAAITEVDYSTDLDGELQQLRQKLVQSRIELSKNSKYR